MKNKADKFKAFWKKYLEYRQEGFTGFSSEGVHVDNECFREFVPATAQIENEITGHYIERTATLSNGSCCFCIIPHRKLCKHKRVRE